MRKEKGDFFIFLLKGRKLHSLRRYRLTESPNHRITESPNNQLFSFKPIPISLNQLNQSIYRFFFGNVFFDAGLTFV